MEALQAGQKRACDAAKAADEAEADRDRKAHMVEEAKKAIKRALGGHEIALRLRDAATKKAKELREKTEVQPSQPRAQVRRRPGARTAGGVTRRSESSTLPVPEAEEEEEGEGEGEA